MDKDRMKRYRELVHNERIDREYEERLQDFLTQFPQCKLVGKQTNTFLFNQLKNFKPGEIWQNKAGEKVTRQVVEETFKTGLSYINPDLFSEEWFLIDNKNVTSVIFELEGYDHVLVSQKENSLLYIVSETELLLYR